MGKRICYLWMDSVLKEYFVAGVLSLLTFSPIIFFPLTSYAAPAYPGLFKLKQPSGYTFEARRRGDERYNWLETKDGYGIYKNKETRNWEYYVPANEADVEKGSKSTQKKYLGKTQDATPRAIVGKTDPASLGIPKGLRLDRTSENRAKTFDLIKKNLLNDLLQSSTLRQGKTGYPSPQENILSDEAEHTQTDSPLKGVNSLESYTLISPLSNSSSEIRLRQNHEKNLFSNKVRGSKQVLVIGVDYKDCPATYSAGEIQSLVFGTSTNSVADYFKKVSYDEVTIEPAKESYGTPTDGFVGWMRLSGNHPNTGYNTGEENIQLAKDAIEAANEYINYADYDKDGDGVVSPTELAIIIVVAGYDAAYGEWKKPSVYAHSGYTYYYYDDSFHFLDYPRNTDDKNIEEYIQIGEKHTDHLATIGVICYELGKEVFALPELIDTYNISSGLGYFDSMAEGCWGAAEDKYKGSSPTYLSAWSREYLSWGTVTTITSSGTISFPKADGNKVSIFRLDTSDPNQYFLIENRDFSGYDVGFQAQTGASGHGGLVVYHIDKSKTTWADNPYYSSIINKDETDKGVDVVEANEKNVGYCILDAPSSEATDGSEITDIFFFSGNNASFTDTSTPSSRLKNGNSTLISITGISDHGGTMTATVTRPPTATTGSVTNLAQDLATLNGTVNAYGLTTTAWFEYGKSSGSHTNTTSSKTISGTTDESVSFDIKNLTAGIFYYYRLAVKNSIGTVYGDEKKFITTKVPPAIAAGGYHNLALKSDGTVWAWGRNDYGQLGDGTTKQKNRAEEVYGLNGIISIAAGMYHSLALRLDGTVWTWGYNSYGTLGARNDFETKIPAEVSGLNGVIAIAARGMYNLALKSDGTVWEWSGPDIYQVGSLDDVTAIAAGNYYGLALKSDGTVWAWGYNNDGQLGDGTHTYRYSSSPVKVSNLTDVIAIAAGNAHSLALKSDGTVWAWGCNWYGQLGDFAYKEKLTPVMVSMCNVTAIAAGEFHSLALLSDGTVWGWGDGGYGQLGDNSDSVKTPESRYTRHMSPTPVKVSDISNITKIAAGMYHSVALKYDGTIFAWGDNTYEQLGNGSDTNKNYPVQVDNINLGEKPSDKLGPIGSVSINGGASYTDSVEVALTLSAMDVYGVTGCCIHDTADTPSLSDPNWKTVSSSTLYSEDVDSILSRGDGIQTVYVCYKDAEGNRSSVASDSIILDTTDPTITITSPTSDSTYTTTSSTISLSGEASDNGSGVSSVTWECSNGESGTADGTTSWSMTDITLSEGENTITVTATDGAGHSDTDTITVTYTTTTPTPTASPEGSGSISGFVYDTNNSALQGVTVSIDANNYSDSTETDETGYYEFRNLAAGDYTLTYEKEGYQTQTIDKSLEEDEDLEVETITLEKVEKGKIYGYVVDIYDEPIESANLKLKGFHTGIVKKDSSDENGFFEFTDLEADTYIITAEKSGYRNNKTSVKLKEGEEHETDNIQLRKTSSSGMR